MSTWPRGWFERSGGTRDHRMLPGELARAARGSSSGHGRTARDWVVDLAVFGGAVLFWALTWSEYPPAYADDQPAWFLTVDPWLGALACLALWFRRRFPVVLVWALVPVLAISGTATGAVMGAILTVAVHRSWQIAALATVPYVAMGLPFAYWYPEPGQSRFSTMLFVTLLFVAPLACGIAVRSRRKLVISLYRDVERQRREHELRLGEARRGERERIAREMHDVLAHRISLLSVHAGALAYRTARAESTGGPALDPAELADVVTVIRDNANHALSELGEVLQVLRLGHDESDAALLPQPELAHICRLVSDAEAAGQRVTLDAGTVLEDAATIRPQVQRTAYRVVQEGLTNARKHAPGRPVTVHLDGAPDGDLTVTVANPLPASMPADDALPGAGMGLAGLAERVDLDGGTLEHVVRDGQFRLHARLPWPHDRAGDRTGPGGARR